MSQFSSLQDVIRQLKEALLVTLIVIRYPPAVTQAMSVWSSSSDFVKTSALPSRAFAASTRAFHALERALYPAAAQGRPTFLPKKPPATAFSQPVFYRNTMFRDSLGNPIPYDDDCLELDPDEGTRATLFLSKIDGNNFQDWLANRKRKWRETYRVYKVEDMLVQDEDYDEERFEIDAVAVDFWKPRFQSFEHWLGASKFVWSQRYSWNRQKRQRFERDCEEVVQINDDFGEWLRVRKNQWRVFRRRRQRQRLELVSSPTKYGPSALPQGSPTSVTTAFSYSGAVGVVHPEIAVIDAILEEQERERMEHDQRPPLDISWFFDASLGCPDDTIVSIMSYLDPMEYGKLLCLSAATRKQLQKRECVWRLLCPKKWKLPRRPRKPWHELFLTNLRREKEISSKVWDDLLARVSNILLKGDHLQQIEKLVNQAERDHGFDINYSSGVVCERNAILNLAVIHQRHKVVRWLVEVKKADIETSDRGYFTPLINAAWAGDKYLVRFLLQKGADRTKVGTCHYTKPLASPDFQGFNAAGWADEKGHRDIANLIRIGL